MNKLLLVGIMALLCISFVSAANTMVVDKQAWVYNWETNPCVSDVINITHGASAQTYLDLNVLPIICGVEEGTFAYPYLTFDYMLRCNNASVRVIHYYGDSQEMDSGWVDTSSYYWYILNKYTDFPTYYAPITGGGYAYDDYQWGIIFNGSVNAPFPYRDFNLSGDAIYNTSLIMNKTGNHQIKIMVKSQLPIADNKDTMVGLVSPGLLGPVATAGDGSIAQYVIYIDFTVVDSDGRVPGECSSTQNTYSPPSTNAWSTSFGTSKALWWFVLMIATGFGILFIGGNKYVKAKLVGAGILEVLMLFIGASLKIISWVYIAVLLIIAIAIFAIKFKDWFG